MMPFVNGRTEKVQETDLDFTSGPSLIEISSTLAFLKKLQYLTNRIHAAQDMDEIIFKVSQDICDMFEADRLTLYTVSADGNAIVSRIKTGLHSFKDITLPISDTSIAGFVALNRKILNIRDAYDEAELRKYAPPLTFLRAVDKRTGYRTKQMLVAPILGGANGTELMGVLQLINTLSGEPFSKLAEEGLAELCKTLAIAFAAKQAVALRIGTKFDHLVSANIISAGELELATQTARKKDRSVEDILREEFQVSLAALGESLSRFYSVDYEPFRPDRVKPAHLLRKIKRDYVESSQWLPVEEGPEGLVILTTDPERTRGSRVVENVFPRQKLVYRVSTAWEFKKTLDQFFGEDGSSASIGELLSGLHEDLAPELAEDEISAASENELVKLVNRIIEDAYRQGASDIHIEPYPGKNKTLVRFRKDGTLQPYIEVPANYRSALVTRIKIMCDLDISEKRRPQDGKIKYRKFGPLDIELRVATLPSVGGLEDVVMRILSAGEPMPLDKIGLAPRNLEKIKELIGKPYGIFFVCGPTGSGKTTTLHSCLAHINTPETKIWTAEDPVEITQKGLRQVQMNPKAGLTFATAMRAFLRADPDVIMLGEMRDQETTSIGIEASLTGHLVLTTLHTNSAPESVIRLLDMGMDPFNFADALLGVLAQRLAKRLCVRCKKPHAATEAEIGLLLTEYSAELASSPTWQSDPERARSQVLDEWRRLYANEQGEFTLYKPVGCENCDGTGYRGRVGLHELLVGTDRIKNLIQGRARVPELLAAGIEEGMRTLRQDGIEKVLQGITDMAQVRAVCIK